MRIAEVIGRVTLSRVHPNLQGRAVHPRPAHAAGGADGGLARRGEEVVAFDQLGAGPGSLIGLSEGREAANPFGKDEDARGCLLCLPAGPDQPLGLETNQRTT